MDVPVHDLHGVAVGQGLGHLLDVFTGPRLVKLPALAVLETSGDIPSKGSL